MNEKLPKAIVYRALHRGTKEADYIISNFVKQNIANLNTQELMTLNKLLMQDDQSFFAKMKDEKYTMPSLVAKYRVFLQSI